MIYYKLLLMTFLLLGAIPANIQSLSAGRGRESLSAQGERPITIGEAWRIRSKRLAEEREIRVYLPASYAGSNQRYPVIYALDGESLGQVTASAMQFMTGASEMPQMPEALVVAVTNTNRERDMPIPQEYGKDRGEANFLAFLADELIPAIEQRYRAQPLRVLIGHSQGGLFAYYALMTRPHAFQWYLPIDAPLVGFPQLQSMIEKARDTIKSPDYRGRLVSIEGSLGWLTEWPSLIAAAPRGFYGAQVKITDETHETMVYKGIYEGLKRLFHDFAPATKDASLAELETKYKGLSADYHYQVSIPYRVLLRSASRNIDAKNGMEGLRLADRASELYGASPATRRLLAEAEVAVKKGGPDSRIAEYMNTPPPSAAQMKPFLGVWAGRVEAPDRVPLDVEMSFVMAGNVPRASSTVTGPGGGSFEVQIEFLKVLNARKLQWGNRNRGAGIYVHTGTLVDENTLKVEEEGIGIPRRPGVDEPPMITIFKRKASGIGTSEVEESPVKKVK